MGKQSSRKKIWSGMAYESWWADGTASAADDGRRAWVGPGGPGQAWVGFYVAFGRLGRVSARSTLWAGALGWSPVLGWTIGLGTLARVQALFFRPFFVSGNVVAASAVKPSGDSCMRPMRKARVWKDGGRFEAKAYYSA